MEPVTRDPDRRALVTQALSLSVAVIPFGVAFGVIARQAGLGALTALGYSSLVFTGSAQFAAVAVLGSGGTIAAAVAAGLLLNLRCVAFGVIMAPSFPRSWWRRVVGAQAMIDETTAVATSVDDRRLRWFGYVVTGVCLFSAWNAATLVGALAVPTSGTLVEDLGIDATIPAAFLALLWPRLSDARQRPVALGGAAVALLVLPIAPPGLPIVLAGVAVLLAWRTAATDGRVTGASGSAGPAGTEQAGGAQ